MKLALPVLSLFVLLSACGHSDTSSTSSAGSVGSTPPPISVQTPTGYQLASGIQGSYPYFFANYQFKENGCDTGEHSFSGPTAQIVAAQLCQGLQNSWQNHNCAADLRQSYYAQACQ